MLPGETLMDATRISDIPGWASIFQGGQVKTGVTHLPSPLILVCMNAGEIDDSWIDHKIVQGVLAVSINDNPWACLPDLVLVSLASACVEFLKQKINILVHCGEGVSRSTYMDIAIHCIAFG